MPTNITVIPPSASTAGQPIKIAATGTPGTLIHAVDTATITTAGSHDLLVAAVYNSDTVDRQITFECGGVTSPDHHVGRIIPAKSTLKVPLPSLTAGNYRAFGAAANVLIVAAEVEKVRLT